jgi:CheY-like chemotaxis protein
MRVLVVEDEAELGDVLRDFLLELGHQPLVVRSAEAALGSLQTERPDAIILDIALPGMSGLDFLQLRPVRELDVPIVAVSGVVTESQARECLRLGAADFVGKPVSLERLEDILAYVELLALSRPIDPPPGAERRHVPRARVAFPVRVIEYGGAEHTGESVEIGVAGIKVRLGARLERTTAARLVFEPPDGGPPVSVIALVRRVDPDGHVFTFVHLPDGERQRLGALVRTPRR